MIPRLRNRLLPFSFVPLRIVSHKYSFIILCYILLLPSPHYIRQLTSSSFTSLGKPSLLPLFRRPPTIVHASAPPSALLIRCLVTVFSPSHNPSLPDVHSLNPRQRTHCTLSHPYWRCYPGTTVWEAVITGFRGRFRTA